jgi:tetratricopeptide (TPR) repeat protein
MRNRAHVYLLAAFAASFAMASCSKDIQKLKRQYVESGDKFVAEEKYSDAVIQYRNAVVLDSNFGEARFKLADAYSHTNDVVNALREYVRAADLMPENVEAQLRAGNGLLATGQYPEAKARAIAALSKEPKNVRGLVLLGNAMAGMKDIDGAISQVKEAIEADPRETLAYENLGGLQLAKGDRSAAENTFKRAVELAPKSESAHLALANYYWAAGALPDAERHLKTALELEPKSVVATRALAVFYSLANRPDEAEKYLVAYANLSSTAGPKVVLADYYLLRNRLQEARNVLTPMLTTKDGYVPSKLRLAAIDFSTGSAKQAHLAVDEVLKQEPRNEDALLEKGRFAMIERKPAEALAQANQVLALNPKSTPAHYLKGTALHATGSLDESVKTFQALLQLSPGDSTALREMADLSLVRGDAAAALEFSTQMVAKQPRAILPHYYLAKSLVRLGNLARAEREVMGLAKANPASADVQVLVGDFYQAKQDLVRAGEAYERALKIQSQSFQALTGVVVVNLAQNKPDAAKARIESQLAKTPDDQRVLLLAGRTYAKTHDPTRAEATLRRVLQLNPSSIDAFSLLGALYGSQNRLEEARKEYEEMARHNAKMAVPANTMVAMILSMQQKHDEARTRYEQVLALDPQSPVAANNLAWYYAENGQNLDIALNLAQTAKARLPDAATVSDTLGWVYYKKGMASLALLALEEAARQAPGQASIRYHLGLAYVKNGDAKKARASLEQALKLSPDFKEASDARKVLATMKG